MELLNFIFSDFWHWIGTCFLLWIPFDGIAKIIEAFKGEAALKEGNDERVAR